MLLLTTIQSVLIINDNAGNGKLGLLDVNNKGIVTLAVNGLVNN